MLRSGNELARCCVNAVDNAEKHFALLVLLRITESMNVFASWWKMCASYLLYNLNLFSWPFQFLLCELGKPLGSKVTMGKIFV